MVKTNSFKKDRVFFSYPSQMNKLEELANLKQGLIKGFITKQDYNKLEKRILLNQN